VLRSRAGGREWDAERASSALVASQVQRHGTLPALCTSFVAARGLRRLSAYVDGARARRERRAVREPRTVGAPRAVRAGGLREPEDESTCAALNSMLTYCLSCLLVLPYFFQSPSVSRKKELYRIADRVTVSGKCCAAMQVYNWQRSVSHRLHSHRTSQIAIRSAYRLRNVRHFQPFSKFCSSVPVLWKHEKKCGVQA
jgi:hypothetical protein